jgi:hypothetical protein
MSYTFMDINLTTISILERTIINQILSQEPRVADITIQTDDVTKPGCLIIEIGYTIISNNVRDNLVFPFYLEAAAEDEENEQSYEAEEYIPYEGEEVSDLLE